jgi:uncharacterized protein YceH (UPF0502 family)
METETGEESGIESGVEGGVVPLTFAEARVLGCLIEKELTTPEYYPLTSGALTAACNQKSNRDPVVEWDEREVMETVESLRLRKLALMQRLSGARVPKYRHAFHEVYGGVDGAMMAVLCELLVRNVQTFGELRTRAGRMHVFPDLEAVEAAVQRLVDYPGGGLVVVLPPGGGRRVKAVGHPLSGPVEVGAETVAVVVPVMVDGWRERMEGEIGELRELVERLRAEVAELRAVIE